MNPDYHDEDFNIDNHICNLFPPLIYRFQFPFDYTTLEPLVEANLNSMIQAPPNVGPNLTTMSMQSMLDTSYEMPHTWPAFYPFIQFVHQITDQVKKRNLIQGSHCIVDSFLNRLTKDGFIREHNHVPATFSLVAYPKPSTGGAKLVFRDPLEYHKGNYGLSSFSLADVHRKIEVSTNDVLIFPSFMYHYTTPHNLDHDRISFALNIRCDSFVQTTIDPIES